MDDPLWSPEPPLQQGQLLTTGPEGRQDAPPPALDDLPDRATRLLDHPVRGDALSGERWSLPAGPLAHVLTTLRADDYMGDGDMATFAQGLGLDPNLTRSVLAGGREKLSGDEVVSVCKALGCSPFDIWEKGRVDDVHDQGRWPESTAALDGSRGDHDFVRRRLDQQGRRDVLEAGEATPRPSGTGEPVRLEITRYRQGDVLAIDSTGHRHRVSDPDQPVQPGTEYHFTFRRLGGTETVAAPLTSTVFAEGSPPGRGVEPRLASLADSMDPGADMVRFRDPTTGVEQWIGRDTPFDDWQSWDDPRRYYPGDPADVLDDRLLVDHPELPFAETAPLEPDFTDGLVDLDEPSIDF